MYNVDHGHTRTQTQTHTQTCTKHLLIHIHAHTNTCTACVCNTSHGHSMAWCQTSPMIKCNQTRCHGFNAVCCSVLSKALLAQVPTWSSTSSKNEYHYPSISTGVLHCWENTVTWPVGVWHTHIVSLNTKTLCTHTHTRTVPGRDGGNTLCAKQHIQACNLGCVPPLWSQAGVHVQL